MLVDSQRIKHYGSLVYNGDNLLREKGVKECGFIRCLEDGSQLVFVVTHYHEVLFVTLY